MTARLIETPNRKQPPVPGGRPHRVRVQLTGEQLQVLQQLSREMDIGIPEILVSSALDDPKRSSKARANELAGIRRLVTDEVGQLRRIADAAERNEWDTADINALDKAIQVRNLRLAEFLGW